MRRLINAREYADLTYLALIGLVTVRPRTWMVWLMPALAVFHIPSAALISLATLTAEGDHLLEASEDFDVARLFGALPLPSPIRPSRSASRA